MSDVRGSLDSFDSGDGLEQSRDDLDDSDAQPDSPPKSPSQQQQQQADRYGSQQQQSNAGRGVSDSFDDTDGGGGGANDTDGGGSDAEAAESSQGGQLQYDSAGESSLDGSELDNSDYGAPRPNLGDFDYSALQVPDEVQQLFDFIASFKPADIELQTTLKPFIPEYIPAVGDIDAFLKVPTADGRPEMLGLTVVDEPATNQTDPTVLEMLLRQITKQRDLQPAPVRGLENATLNPKAIKAWVQKVNDLHKTKPAPSVTYQKPMPDIESLMQEWPNEIEKLLETAKLPTADLDVDVKTFSRIICAVVDIPIHANIVEGLHVLFTLYSAFNANLHFRR